MSNSKFLAVIGFIGAVAAVIILMAKGPNLASLAISGAGFFAGVMSCVCKAIEDIGK